MLFPKLRFPFLGTTSRNVTIALYTTGHAGLPILSFNSLLHFSPCLLQLLLLQSAIIFHLLVQRFPNWSSHPVSSSYKSILYTATRAIILVCKSNNATPRFKIYQWFQNLAFENCSEL